MAQNFLKNDTAKDSSQLWRGILAFLVVLISVGVFVLQKVDLPAQSNFNLSKYIEPINEIEEGSVGGDIVITPPQPVKSKLPELTGEMLSADKFSAHKMIVKDYESGAVLFRKDEYTQWPIASITKLMSALIILEKEPDWTTSTQVIPDDIVDTHMYAGDTYSLEELWHAALVGSSNKAILTLSDAVGWPREAFIERMNQKARELGMIDTYFVDPTGLSENNISTASDVILLLNEVMKFEKLKQALLVKEYNLYSKERNKQHHIWNTDWILLDWIPNEFIAFHGGKTGYIPASGYNFTMRVEDGEGRVLDVVVLGTDSHEGRFTEARDVAEWVFTNYKWF